MAERPNTLQKPSFAAAHDVERGHAGPYIRLGEHLGVGKGNANSEPNTPGGQGHSRDSSFLHDATHFDSRKGPEQFRVAQGDIPDNQVKLYFIRLLDNLLIVPPRLLDFTIISSACLWSLAGLYSFSPFSDSCGFRCVFERIYY